MDNTSRKKLHDLLVKENLYTKSYGEFESQFSNPESQKKLYGLLTKEGLYSKSDSEFNNQFFSNKPSVEKKNPNPTTKVDKKNTALPSTSADIKSSSASKSFDPKNNPYDYWNDYAKSSKFKESPKLNEIGGADYYPPADEFWRPDAYGVGKYMDARDEGIARSQNPNPNEVQKGPSKDLLHQVVSGPSASFSAAPTKKKPTPQKPVTQSEGTLLQPTKTQEGLDVAGRFDVLKKGWKNLDTDISTNVNRQRELQQTQLKDLTYSANKLEQDKNKFQQKVDQFEQEYKTNPTNPDLAIKQKQLLDEQKNLSSRLDSFKFQKDALDKSDAVVSQAIKDKNATIGELENFGRQIAGAGAKAIAAFDAIPMLALNGYLDLTMAATGKSEEFNKLPAAAKQELRKQLMASLKGTGTDAIFENSEMLYNYWDKFSSKVLEDTIEQEGDTFDDMAKFVSQPSLENAGNLLRRGTTGLAQAIPYMAQTLMPGGLITLGLSSAAGKRMEDVKEDGNVGLGYLFTAGVTGGAEAIFEGKTNEILKRVGARIVGNKKASEALTKKLFLEIAKDFNEEGISEGLTTFFQETSDKLNKGEPIDLRQLTRKIGESYIMGGTIGGGLTGGGAVVSNVFKKAKDSPAGRNLLTNALITAEDRKRLEEIRDTTQDLTTQKADDNDPAVNEVIDEKLSDLESEYREITAKYDDAIEGLTQEEARDLFNIDDKIDEIKTRAEAIKNDPNLTDDAKKLLWQKLKQEFEPLKEQRDAIQKQTTSKVSVQPEAGTGLQVAEGEPQAKPEGVTEEVKVEKIGQALDADNTFTMRGNEGNLFVDDNGLVLFESGDEIVELGNIADVSESDLKDFGLEAKEPVAIEIGEDGSIEVAGKKYVNVAEAPMDAITFDQDGNVKSVRLETENGQSRYFRGKRAESIAYQYTLQNLEKNGTDEQIDTIINQATEADRTQEQTGEVTNEAEDAVVDEGAKQEKLDLDNVSETSGVKPKNLRQLIRVNKKLFGLSWTKATMSAIAMDRMIGAMAKRAGISKEEMYQRIEFRTKDQAEPTATDEVVAPDATTEVTAVEEAPKTRKPRAPKKPAFENVEITETIEPTTPEEQAYVEDQAVQPILWSKVPKQKGDPKIAARNKTIMQAAQDLLDGKITNEQYREIVQNESPIVPIEQFFEPATEQEVNNALSKDKVGLVDSPTEKGTVFTDSKGEEFEVTSDEVGLRLDIPAFINNNAWVVTVHGDVTNKKTGKKTKDKAISYGNVARITGVKFDFSPTQAIAVATKKQDKVPFLKMRGKMAPIEGATMDERAENAKKMLESIKNDPAWTQIGSNPFKHSGFFNRATGQPILGADEVLQIGGLVFAKNVKETTWDNPIFEVKGEKGGPKPTDAAGKNVLFQGNRASVEIASDGTAIIYAMTDPNVSSPLHELAHIFQHYLTEAEWDVITKWAGGTKWSVETSEKFARGFEKFLSEGKAPNKELQKIFDKFKEWLTDIYNGITGSEIDIKLNPAMRKIYAQMFNEKVAKPKEAPSAQKILGIKPKMVTVDEMASLKGQLNLQAKAAKTAYDFAEAARKLVATYIKNNVRGALSAADQKAIFRAMEGKLDTPENKKKMIDKITGILQASEGKIAVNDFDALNRMYKADERGQRGGIKKMKDQLAKTIATIKAMGIKNQLKPAQVKLLLNGLRENLFNETIRDNFFKRVQKVLNDAQYAEEFSLSKRLKSKLRKRLKNNNNIADVQAVVRDFLKVNPKYVDDIYEYNELAIEIYDAISKPKVVNGNVVERTAVELAKIAEYANERIKVQEKIKKEILLNQYKNLVEYGIINSEMTFDQLMEVISNISTDPNSVTEDNGELLREYAKKSFDEFAETINQMLEEGDLDDQDIDFDMVKKFINMDIETLALDKQMEVIDSMNNFIVNGVTSRMGAILQTYTGVENAESDKASGMKARPLSYGLIGRIAYLKQVANKGLVANILKGVASIGDAYNEVMATYISKADSLVTGVFRSTTIGMKFMKNSGFAGVVRGFVQGKIIVNEFAKKYSEKFDGSKPNGMDFKSALNIYERGIFADLSRTIKNGTPEQIKKEFDRKKKQLELTIKTLRETGKQELIDKADLYDSVYQKIKNAKNIEEVKQNVDPINQAAVKEVQDMWRKYYPEFRRMAADYYNVILEEDVDYSPDMYEKLAEEVADDLLVKGAFKMAFDVVSTEKTGTLQKNKRIEGLPINKDTKEINRVRDYDFDFNSISALEKTLIDVRTTPFVQQFMGYTNSAAFREIFPDMDERALILKRLNFNINALRERQDTYSSKLARKLNKISTSLSKYGTRIGLGSLSSAPKQSIPMVANTMVNMIDDLASFGSGIADFWNDDAMNFLENSGYGISLRGAESQTSIDFAQKLVERANQGKVGNLQEQLAKLGDMYIEKFLKNPDVMVANMAWLGYYRSKLKSMGVDMTNFDWKNHELNEEAADYAEFMVQDQQNMNISELGGKLLASKDASTKIIRQLLFPFASYQFNLKDKNNRNLTILTSKTSTNDEKVMAAKSYAAGLVEAYTFQTIQGLIGTMLLAAAYSAIGYDQPDEEKTDGILDAIAKAMPFLRSKSSSEKWNDSLFVGKSMFEFISPLPLPGALESYTLIGLNGLMDMIQGGTPQEQAKEKKELEKQENTLFGRKAKRRNKKVFGAPVVDKEAEKLKEKLEAPFRFPVKEEQRVSQTIGDIVGGVPSVGIEAVWDMGVRGIEAFGDSYEDKYGNVYEYSDEQKKILKTSLIPRAMVAMNIAPREFLTISNNIVKAVNQKAKEDTKAKKESAKRKVRF